MPVRERPDRRGRPVRGSDGLLERDGVLAAIDQTIDAAMQGVGGALLIEGHAGMGKTRLHEAALDRARAQGMRVLRAAGAELEVDIALGVASQLLEVELHSAREARRLFPVLAGEEGARPTVVAIDDLHWCDAASLEFVLHLLHRLEELPLAVVLTRRLDLGQASWDAIDRIASHPRVAVHALSALGRDAVGEIVREMLDDRADEIVIAACHESTSGNPFYVRELLMALREEPPGTSEQLAARARALAPPAVTRILRVRVGRVGAAGRALARAVAVLGDDAPIHRATELAGLEAADAAAAADALAAVEILLAREPLRFVHPLVRHAIANDMPRAERASQHLRAARLLHRDGADSERVAAHLLVGHGRGDPWAVEQLQLAARDARNRGAPGSAARFLTRALQEPPAEPVRARLLGELGRTEAAAGLPRAAEHLEQAAAGTTEPIARAQLALHRARVLYAEGQHAKALAAYRDGLRELEAQPSSDEARGLHDALHTDLVAMGLLLPGLSQRSTEPAIEQSAEAEAAGRGTLEVGTSGRLLAQAAAHSAVGGQPAQQTFALAQRAWDEGRLLGEDGPDGAAWILVAIALSWSGAFERCAEILDAVAAEASRRACTHTLATVSYLRGTIELQQARVSAACAHVERARRARRSGWGQFLRAAEAFHCLALLVAGAPDRAREVLEATEPLAQPTDLQDAMRLLARAEIHLAGGRGREALSDALAFERLVGPSTRVFGTLSWRATAARAALLLGERERALELAREEHRIAERTGALHARIRAHRVLGLAEQGDRGIELLRTAAELGSAAPTGLETIASLVELGAALRRANRRVEARGPLERAADLASSGGAQALARRARMELAASGARPRRDRLISGPESLTPSERRIAELAAQGQSNREIAQALYVTPKTVEYHLRNAYRKLAISGRGELARTLES